MSIGKNIKKRRLELNMSQDELAEKLFVTRQTISNYEIGKSNATIETLQELSVILDCELEELVYGKKKEDKQIDKKKLYQYIFVLVGLLFFNILIVLFEPKLKEWQSLNYRNSAILLSKDLFLVPMIFCIYGYIFGSIAKLYRMNIPQTLTKNKILHYVLCGIAFVLAIDNIALFIGLGIDNLNMSRYYYFRWFYRFSISMQIWRLLVKMNLNSSIYSLINIFSLVIGLLISFTKKEK